MLVFLVYVKFSTIYASPRNINPFKTDHIAFSPKASHVRIVSGAPEIQGLRTFFRWPFKFIRNLYGKMTPGLAQPGI